MLTSRLLRSFQLKIYDRLIKQQEEAFSVLDRIWEKTPKVSEEEVQTDIEQAIAEERSEKL